MTETATVERRHISSPDTRVFALSIALGMAAAVLGFGVLARFEPLDVPFDVPWTAIAALSFAAELLVVRLESRGETQMLSLGDIPITIGLALTNPLGLVVGRLVGAGAALGLVRRQPPRKLFFNLCLFAFETVLAACVYRMVLGSSSPIEVVAWVATAIAILVADATSVLGVTAVIALYTGEARGASIPRALQVTWPTGLACTAIGLGIVASLWHHPPLVILFIPVVACVFLINRTYLTLSQRYRSLETLHRFTREVGGSLHIEKVGESVLAAARDLMRGDIAHLILLESEAGVSLLISSDEDGTHVRTLPSETASNALIALAPDLAARIIESPGDVPAWLNPVRPRDAVVAPIAATTAAVGVLMVVNSRADSGGFDRRDLTFFETLANHASKALENGQLYRHLQVEAAERTRQALHDPLTGLPNRQLLDERLSKVLADSALGHTQLAVLLIDLELFKEVNDTLGHHVGDRILKSVCQRLEAAVPEAVLLTRFGGDEFVAILPDITSEAPAVALAERLIAALEQPFVEQDLDIVVGASIGIAMYPEHAVTASTLLQRADVAMYRAKNSRSGFEVYVAELDPFTPRRLALAGGLREAIDRGEIEVLFQPQVEVASGRVIGAEALVRWHHPSHGLLKPDEFIPAAEHNGSIKPLTKKVLAISIAACRAWRDAGHDLTVSVNLSMTSLLDIGLPDDVRTLLDAEGLAPESLLLELTEGSIMTESRRSVTVLSALDRMGVRLSIDDFGTGYSSLSHLRRLPISEIKIDRSFIADLAIDEHDEAIVRTTIDLGHHLGLKVVAEGAESLESMQHLRDLGCDLAQGFVISRPRSQASFESWLEGQDVAKLVEVTPATSLEQARQRRDQAL